MEVPSGVQGITPDGGLEAKPPETGETLEIVTFVSSGDNARIDYKSLFTFLFEWSICDVVL